MHGIQVGYTITTLSYIKRYVQACAYKLVVFMHALDYDLYRNRCTKKSNRDFKIAEAKVIIFCTGYAFVGIGATISYGISSAPLRQINQELTQYFECEQTPHSGMDLDQPCDKSGYGRLTNPTLQIIAWCLIAVYPVTTLIYFLYKKRHPKAKHMAMHNNSSSNRPTTSSSVK